MRYVVEMIGQAPNLNCGDKVEFGPYDDLDEAVGAVATFAVIDPDNWDSEALSGLDVDGNLWSIWPV